jgi:hypothetical protein
MWPGRSSNGSPDDSPQLSTSVVPSPLRIDAVPVVIAGLDPAIHPSELSHLLMDARVVPAPDDSVQSENALVLAGLTVHRNISDKTRKALAHTRGSIHHVDIAPVHSLACPLLDAFVDGRAPHVGNVASARLTPPFDVFAVLPLSLVEIVCHKHCRCPLTFVALLGQLQSGQGVTAQTVPPFIPARLKLPPWLGRRGAPPLDLWSTANRMDELAKTLSEGELRTAQIMLQQAVVEAPQKRPAGHGKAWDDLNVDP